MSEILLKGRDYYIREKISLWREVNVFEVRFKECMEKTLMCMDKPFIINTANICDWFNGDLKDLYTAMNTIHSGETNLVCLVVSRSLAEANFCLVGRKKGTHDFLITQFWLCVLTFFSEFSISAIVLWIKGSVWITKCL